MRRVNTRRSMAGTVDGCSSGTAEATKDLFGCTDPKWGFVNLKMQLRSSGELSFESYGLTVLTCRTSTLDPAVHECMCTLRTLYVLRTTAGTLEQP